MLQVASSSLDSKQRQHDILNCDFLVVSTPNNPYNQAGTVVVPNVKIELSTASPTTPVAIRFWSGGQYYLSDGYSIYACGNLSRTSDLKLR